MFTLTPITVFFMVSSAISLLVARIAWLRRREPGVMDWFRLMILLFLWSFTNVFESSAKLEALKVFFSKLEYIPSSFVPLLFLGNVLRYTSRSSWSHSRLFKWAFIVPVVLVLLAFTNEWHHLIWTGFSSVDPVTNLMEYEHGYGFYVLWVGFSYICLLMATFMLLEHVLVQHKFFRWQGLMLLLAIFSPWLASIFYILDMNILPGLNITPISFILSGIFFLTGVSTSHFLDLVPVAREIILDELKDGVLLLDHHNRVSYANATMVSFLGTDQTRFLGVSWEMLKTNNRDLKTEILNAESDQPHIVFCADADQYFEIYCYPLHNYAGSRIFLVRDITFQKKVADEIERMNAQLKEVNAQKDRLFSIIAHDLRNYFSVILGFSELISIQMEERDYNSVNSSNAAITEASLQANELMENLLVWAKTEGGFQIVKREPIDLRDWIQNNIHELKSRFLRKELSLEVNVPEGLIVNVDINALSTVLRNLLINCVKFTPRGGRVKVYKRDATEPGFVEVVVEDNGIGVPASLLPKLFTSDEKTGRLGTEGESSSGFGLLLVKQMVELLGGKIRFESEEGKGTRALFTLPLAH
ncbi:MAG: histidine kinase N-terminal 7TM domain-containing protein [Bacteroidales bacterium]